MFRCSTPPGSLISLSGNIHYKGTRPANLLRLRYRPGRVSNPVRVEGGRWPKQGSISDLSPPSADIHCLKQIIKVQHSAARCSLFTESQAGSLIPPGGKYFLSVLKLRVLVMLRLLLALEQPLPACRDRNPLYRTLSGVRAYLRDKPGSRFGTPFELPTVQNKNKQIAR